MWPMGVCSSSSVRLTWRAGWKTRHEFDELRLAAGAGLLVEATQVGFDRGLANAQGLCQLRNAADLDDGQQYAQLAWREVVGLGDRLGRRRRLERRLGHEQRRSRCIAGAGATRNMPALIVSSA